MIGALVPPVPPLLWAQHRAFVTRKLMPFGEAPVPVLLVPPLQLRRSPKAMSIRSSHIWGLFQEARSGSRTVGQGHLTAGALLL